MVGTQRSGSNVLRLMLAQLPGVFAPPSVHFITDLQAALDYYGKLPQKIAIERIASDTIRLVKANVLKWPLRAPSLGEVVRRCSEPSLEQVFLAIYDAAAEEFQASHWICKCLENVRRLEKIERVIPDLRMIHLIRDPRDVALSFSGIPVGPKDPRTVGLRWAADQEAALRFRAGTPAYRWVEVRYESLVVDPKTEMKRICNDFNLPYTPDVVNYHLRRDAIEASQLSPLWTNLAKPLQRNNMEKFRKPEHRACVELVEGAAFDYMVMLGYTPLYATGQSVYSPEMMKEIQASDVRLRAEAKAAADPRLEKIHQRRNDVLISLLAARPS